MGNGIYFLQARQKLFAWFVKCERQYGYETLSLTVPTLPPGVLINDPRNVDYVFKNEGIFSKGEFVKRRAWDLFGKTCSEPRRLACGFLVPRRRQSKAINTHFLGNGIINADGEFWKIQRKAGLSFLSTANMRILTDIALPQYLSQSIDYLKRQSGQSVVDLQHVFHEITTQLMGKMAYNVCPLTFVLPASLSFADGMLDGDAR